MKKILCFVLTLISLTAATINCYAEFAYQNNIIEYQETTIVFEQNSQFSEEEQQYIAQVIVDGDPEIMPMGLVCTLFGHKDVTEKVITVDHCVSSTQPRCLERVYYVTTCSRCSRMEKTLISEQQITCCS